MSGTQGREAGSGWKPQPHPDWVPALNSLGSLSGSPAALVALDEASLLDEARRQTGLEDFGNDAWREPFALLLRDLEQEAHLTVVGRLLARHDILRSLVVRLQMAEAERRHPEILEQAIVAPIFITGMARSGTSILFEMIAQDPRFRSPSGYELRHVEPYEAETVDPRIAKTQVELDLWHKIVPELASIHEAANELPDEDTVGQAHEFNSMLWGAFHRVPNYDAWVALSGPAEAFRFHRRMLQHLQWQQPGQQWLLKAPAHLFCLGQLFAEYPDARIIQTHRDPIKVLASSTSLMATLRWQRSDTVDFTEIAQVAAYGYPMMLGMVVDQRNNGGFSDDQFVDVLYADLLKDHLGTIKGIYEALGLALTDDIASRITCYLASKPKGKHGTHTYRFEDLGLNEAEMRGKFAGYLAHYNIPQEQV